MRKLLTTLLISTLLFASCAKSAHWSHKACVDYIVDRHHLTTYSYTVKEIEHEYNAADDEVYCFDITITSGDWSQRYCCFTVVDDGEVLTIDCDLWRD